MNTKIDHDTWYKIDWEADDTYCLEEKRYHEQYLYANIGDTIETTQSKISLYTIHEIRKKQEKGEECKNIRKAWRDYVSTRYHEDERGLICRTAPRHKTVQIYPLLRCAPEHSFSETTLLQLVTLRCSSSTI